MDVVPAAGINGIEIYFEQRGSGVPVLFCNGSGTSIESSGLLIDVFASRAHVLVHDQRGLGKTEIPPGPYTMADYAADALALLDHVGWKSARVFGVSFGGMVAQELAVTAPQRVERLVLACTSPGGAGGASYPLHTLEDMDADERATLSVSLMDTRFTPEWLAAHPRDQFLVDQMASRARPTDPEAQRGMREQLLARAGLDVTDRLGRITCPTLVAAGRYDGIAPLPNSEAIAARVPGAELRVYEGGHGFFGQDAAAIPEMLDFLCS
jgi:pimeloyl-ACP methyl ester carboxylesterase